MITIDGQKASQDVSPILEKLSDNKLAQELIRDQDIDLTDAVRLLDPNQDGYTNEKDAALLGLPLKSMAQLHRGLTNSFGSSNVKYFFPEISFSLFNSLDDKSNAEKFSLVITEIHSGSHDLSELMAIADLNDVSLSTNIIQNQRQIDLSRAYIVHYVLPKSDYTQKQRKEAFAWLKVNDMVPLSRFENHPDTLVFKDSYDVGGMGNHVLMAEFTTSKNFNDKSNYFDVMNFRGDFSNAEVSFALE